MSSRLDSNWNETPSEKMQQSPFLEVPITPSATCGDRVSGFRMLVGSEEKRGPPILVSKALGPVEPSKALMEEGILSRRDFGITPLGRGLSTYESIAWMVSLLSEFFCQGKACYCLAL